MEQRILWSLILAAACSAGCGVSQTASASAAVAPRAAAEVKDELPAGISIRVKTSAAISPRSAAPGERISVAVAEEIALNGDVKVIPGTEAILTVVDANSGSVRGTAPSLELRLTELRFGLVEHAALHTHPMTRAAEIPAGESLTFRLASPLHLKSRGQK